MLHQLLNMIPIGSPGYGGYFAGIVEDNFLIISSKEYEKQLEWDEAVEYYKHLEINGFSDWILPTKEELEVIYQNKSKLEKTAGNFSSVHYWSSSESNSTHAWTMLFSYGNKL